MQRIEPGHVDPGVYRLARRLPTRRVAERYNVSTRSIERWANDPNLGFPQPLVINKRKYWSEAELEQFDATRA
jgi:hypothetical protein